MVAVRWILLCLLAVAVDVQSAAVPLSKLRQLGASSPPYNTTSSDNTITPLINATQLANNRTYAHLIYQRYVWVYPPCNVNTIGVTGYCYDTELRVRVPAATCYLHRYRQTDCTAASGAGSSAVNDTAVAPVAGQESVSTTDIPAPVYIPVLLPSNMIYNFTPGVTPPPNPYTGTPQPTQLVPTNANFSAGATVRMHRASHRTIPLTPCISY